MKLHGSSTSAAGKVIEPKTGQANWSETAQITRHAQVCLSTALFSE